MTTYKFPFADESNPENKSLYSNGKTLLTYRNNRVNTDALSKRVGSNYASSWSAENSGIKVTDATKQNSVVVNSVSDPEDNQIDFHDNKVSLREAIFIAHFLKDKGHGKTTNITFANTPIEGSTNSSDLPPWLLELTRPMPKIDQTNLIINKTKSPPSVILTPAKDNGGNPLVSHNNILEISAIEDSGTTKETGSLSLNRISFSGFNFYNYFQISYKTYKKVEGYTLFKNITERKSNENYVIAVTAPKDSQNNYNLELKNVTFQNIKTKPYPEYDGAQNTPKSNIIFSGANSKLDLENIYLKNNSAESSNSKVGAATTGIDRFDQAIAVVTDDPENKSTEINNTFLIGNDNNTPAKVANTKNSETKLSENQETARVTTQLEEAKSYIYKDSVVHLTPELPFALNNGLPDIITLRYDRPTKGDIRLFSDFSKLVEQVKTVTDDLSKLTVEVVETSEAGTDASTWQNQINQETADLAKARLKAEHDKTYAWVNAGVSILSTVVGLDIRGAVTDTAKNPLPGKGYRPGKLSSKWSTRTALYNRGTSSAITTAMGAFPAFAGVVMSGINLANKINQVDEALEAQEKQTAARIEELNEFRKQAEKNLARVKDVTTNNAEKMKEFENDAYTPSVNLSTNQFKTQRTVVEIQDFEFGLDTLQIPKVSLNTKITYEDFNSGNKGGFQVKVTDRNNSENEFVVADVYVSNYDQLIDYGKAARQASLALPNKPMIVGGGFNEPITQTTSSLKIELPLTAKITIDRSQLANDNSTTVETIANSGHDVVIATDGNEKIEGGKGTDTFHPKLGLDTIYGGSGIDGVVFDVASPVQLTSVSATNQGNAAYIKAQHRKIGDDSFFADNYDLPFESKLYSIESFAVTPFSIVDLSNLPKAENNERYKTIVSMGVKFTGTKFNDVVEFKFPDDDILGYLSHKSNFTPNSDPLYAEIDGGKGMNTLSLQKEDLQGYDYRIKYLNENERSGVIYLIKSGGNARELIKFSNIDLITPSNIQKISDKDIIDIPVKSRLADYDESEDLVECEIFSNNNDPIMGSSNDDKITSGDNNDLLKVGSGDDEVLGGQGTDVIFGEDGEDIINGGKDSDFISGGNDSDVLNGEDGNDQLCGNRGNDQVLGGEGDDVILGEEGEDIINGGKNNDVISGGNDSDTINGDNGNDRVYGDNGDDFVSGNSGDDLIKGGEGNDILSGGTGSDVIYGGDGNNTFMEEKDGSIDKIVITADGNTDTILGLDSNDEIIIQDTQSLQLSYSTGTNGIEIFAGGVLEAIYSNKGDGLTVADLSDIISTEVI